MSDFTNAVIGDSVYCLINGKGKIYKIQDKDKTNYPIIVNFERGTQCGFTLDGKPKINAMNPILFWEKPDIIEKKRKVKKIREYYIALIKYHEHSESFIVTFNNPDDFDPDDCYEILFGPEKRTIEYEVEE